MAAKKRSSRPYAESAGYSPKTPATGTSLVNVGPTERVLSTLAGAALAYAGIQSKSKAGGAALAALGTGLAFRGVAGYCPLNDVFGRDSAAKQPKPIEIKETFTVYRDIDRVYGYWRRFENLPNFMEHLESIEELDQRRSHWVARIPGGLGTVEWDSEVTRDEPNRLIAYQSLPGPQVDQSGEVRFRQAEGGKGTELQVVMHYRAPLGALGQGVAKLLNPALSELIRSDIRRFKMMMETGEVPTIEGQPSGRGHDKG
ncbi:SRPBCC family protein [Hymenobacter fodinae]|uniref:SRPBCC family protein n=1 Tax=Hymenobacter fodinae TaxID=2510796 RepID=A0A4Z0P7W7_9BACT|nr:SRPBCC family protein [Hymenobacter fodinae]TGE08443.1 SRPBCC family protein [Hymenobacter fodinae]